MTRHRNLSCRCDSVFIGLGKYMLVELPFIFVHVFPAENFSWRVFAKTDYVLVFDEAADEDLEGQLRMWFSH